MAPEDLLLHLCVHATMRHHFNLGALALVDVVFLVETHPIDWQAFLKAVSAGGGQRCALALLYLAKRNLGAKIPDEVIDALGGRRDEAVWLTRAEYLLLSLSKLADHQLLSDSRGEKIFYSMHSSEKIGALLSVAFPPRHFIAREFSVSADSMKAFLYYPLRWQRLLSKRLPHLLSVLLPKNKRSFRQLALHRTAFSDWLCEKPPRRI